MNCWGLTLLHEKYRNDDKYFVAFKSFMVFMFCKFEMQLQKHVLFEEEAIIYSKEKSKSNVFILNIFILIVRLCVFIFAHRFLKSYFVGTKRNGFVNICSCMDSLLTILVQCYPYGLQSELFSYCPWFSSKYHTLC